MVEQRVDQRAVAIARRGMDDQPGGLVDDQQMLVLEHDPSAECPAASLCAGVGSGTVSTKRFVAADLGAGIANSCRRLDSSAPLRISAFRRSRDRVGTAAASARSSRQPAWLGPSATSMI